MSTALTLYYSNAPASVSTDDQLYSTLGSPTTAAPTTIIGTATGWGQLYPQGNASAWPALGAIGAPDDHGFLFDVNTLEGQEFLAGVWTGALRLNTGGVGAGTITADLYIRVSKRSSGGTLTLITDLTLLNQTISSVANYAPVVTTGVVSPGFVTGDKVALNIWVRIITNGSTASTANLKLNALSTDTVGKTGAANGSVVTPGFQPTPVVSTSPTTLSFAANVGGANPASQNSTLSETAGTSTAWTSSISYGSGSGWLAISPTSGTLTASGNQVVGFTCTTGALAAGTYTATVTFTATNGGATATVGVTFVVTALPAASTSPTTLSFADILGGLNPATQNSVLSNIGGASSAWTSAIAYGSGSGWLAISPTSGTLGASANQTEVFTCTTLGLQPGTYTATVTFTFTTGGSTATVGVTFVVSAQQGCNVLVAGLSVPILESSYQSDDSISSVSTVIMKVRDDAGTNHYTKGQPVEIYDSVNGLQFTGFVQTAIEDRVSPNPLIKTDIGARDNHYLAEKRTYDGPEFTNTPAGAIFCQILNVLGQEGITAKYAADRDSTATDFNAGTLTNVTGASTVGDGDLELSLAGSVVTYNDASLSLLSSPTIKFVGTSVQGYNNNFCYREVWSGSQLIATGDAFTYDVWVSSTSPAIVGGMDFVCTDGTTFRDSALVGTDQQGLGSHPSTDLSGLANDQWYTRSCGVSGALIGKTIAYATVALEGDTAGTYTIFIRNAKWFNGGTVKTHFFDSTQNTLQSNVQMQISGYNNVAISVVNSYDKTAIQTVGPHSISAAAIVQSSQFNWAFPTLLDASATIAFQTSIDGGATYQPITNHASIPNLLPGMSVGSRNMYYQCILTCGKDPTLPPSVSAVQIVVNPAYTATKTDVISTSTLAADWNAGTKTDTKTVSPSGLTNNGFSRAFNQVSDYNGVTTMFGSGGEVEYIQQLQLTATSGNDTRSRLDFAGNWQDFTAEIDMQVPGSGGGVGLVYRTTNWGNNNDTYAYSATLSMSAVLLAWGSNSTGAGSFNTILNVPIIWVLTADSWHHMKVVVSGSNHKVYIDDILYINQTDTHYAGAGNLGVRFYNSAASTHFANFKNFGVASNLVGTWVSPSISLASATTYGTSVLEWDTQQIPGTSIIGAETSINGGAYTSVLNGGQIAGLSPGDNLAGKSLTIRMTLTCAGAFYQPILNGVTVWLVGQYSASGNRISPVLSLANVGRLGGSVIQWNNVALATGCTLGVDARVDAGSWVAITGSNGGPIPGLNAQPNPTNDGFDSNTSANYTSTFATGGSVATATFDTAYSRLLLTGGSNALYISTAPGGIADLDMFVDMDESDNGGLVWHWIDGNNYYDLIVRDDQSAGSPISSLTLRRTLAGVTTQIGQVTSLSWVRGTYRRYRVTMLGSVITCYVDGISKITYTDATPVGAGTCGVRNDAATKVSRYYQINIQPQGDDVSSHTVQTRMRLASTNPVATTQVTDLNICAFGLTIQVGVTIAQTTMFHQYIDKCIDSFAQASGSWWYIDKNKVPYFLPTNGLPAPWIASDGGIPVSGTAQGDFMDANITVEDSSDLYRNRSIINNVLAPITINETKIGDGASTSWTFGNQWAGAPTITITVGGVSTVATVGVQNVDTGKQFYYTPGSNSITEDSSGPVYDLTFSLNFTGPGQFLTYSQKDDTAGQAARAAIEKTGTGIVTIVEDGTGLTKAQGDALAQSRLNQYSKMGRLLKATTRRYGLAPGQLLNVFLPAHNIFDGQFLIRNVQTKLKTEFPNGTAGGAVQQPWMSIEAISGADVGDWTKMYQRPPSPKV